MKRDKWPTWWDWELELSPHLLRHMVDRGFNEIDLRAMMQHAVSVKPDIVPGRWVVTASRRQVLWKIIVEPDSELRSIVIITAFPVR